MTANTANISHFMSFSLLPDCCATRVVNVGSHLRLSSTAPGHFSELLKKGIRSSDDVGFLLHEPHHRSHRRFIRY